jgi:Protein of unknown function (DUF3662)/Inner membrane component of T3SS, cytoplasmic domain
MNPLRTLETTLASLVEGAFGRIFRSEVRPMELARKLVREMDKHRTISVSRVYAPNEYEVWLSQQDRDRYRSVEEDLIDELCAYLLEHARGEQLTLVSPPLIVFHTDPELSLGEFGIHARLVALEDDEPLPEVGAADASGSPDEHGQTMIYSTSRRLREPLEQARAHRPERALLLVDGRRLLVAPGGAVIGRGRDCDIMLEDVGISRRHARIGPAAEGWTIEDLGSTNGVRVNDREIHGAHGLRLGDRIGIGSTEIVFELR